MEQELILKNYEKIVLSIKHKGADITIKSSNDINKIVFESGDNVLYDIQEFGNELFLEFSNEKRNGNIIDRIFDFGFNSTIDITLFINENVKSLEIEATAGDLNVKDLKIKNLKTKLIAGDMIISGLNLEQLNCNLTTGDLSVKDSEIKYAYLKMTTGDTSLNNTKINKIMASLVTGDLKIDYLTKNFKESEIKVITGDATISVEGETPINLKKSISMASSLKSNITLNNDYGINRNLKIKIITGDVRIKQKKLSNSNSDFINSNSEEDLSVENEIQNINMLTQEEQKIIELLKSEKISKTFAIELLEQLGYKEEEAKKFLDDRGVQK
ncbi:DUF4097 family beta strand repeat-containing protein [Oceanotoga teriensis]|uniref:DUF4097 family beta strand repeat-containing protein n=1 Tax=Oceanotoga teriensis TaxID=515440 RepID=UPI002713BDBB|nr:DUF4097 family beta strand repeat-containing protein [Oceanotoga teriensis]MDO7975539.1 DUF4097 domain-containing protein [Oceanotoga teriensis]